MSKEAIVFVIDVSQRMAQEASPGRTRLAEALEGVQRLVEAKLLQSKQNEVGVVLCGAHDTANELAEDHGGYEHVQVLSPLAKPPISLLAELRDVQPEEDSCDFINGLVVAVDLMHRRTNKKQYTRSIYLVTPAEDQIEGIDDLELICERMLALQTSLCVIGPGFSDANAMEIDAVASSHGPERQEMALSVKQQNEQLLRSIAEQIGGRVMSTTDMVSALSGLQCKSVRPTKNKCVLAFGAHDFDVSVFTRTKQAAVPSLKQECTKAYDPTDPVRKGTVKQDRSYRDPSNHDVEVPPDDLVSGYRYGSTLVPLTDADQEAMKILTDRARMIVIGFTLTSRIKPQLVIGETRCVIPELGNARSESAVGALALALKQTERSAVVRFVARKNAAPKLCALRHDDSCSEYPRLLMLELPFADDFRRFSFASLDPEVLPAAMAPTDQQYKAAEAVVDAMGLDPRAFSPEGVFNPTAQRIRQATVVRVQDPEAELPPVDPRVQAYMNPSSELLKLAQPALTRFAQHFPFKAVEVGKKRKYFWSDILGEEGALGGSAGNGAGADDGSGAKKFKADAPQGPSAAAAAEAAATAPQTVGSVNPVADFEAMLGAPDTVKAAVESMKARIVELVTDGANTAYYKKAMQCLVALRKGCLAQGESSMFNQFMRAEVKANFSDGQHSAVWEIVVESEVSLITAEEDSVVDVSAAEAAAFLQEAVHEETPAASLEPAAEGSDEEMFEDIA